MKGKGGVVILQGQDAGRCLTGDNFSREVGPGEHAGYAPRCHLPNDLGHAHAAAFLETFAQADDRDAGRQVRYCASQYLSEVAAGYGDEHGFRVLYCVADIGCGRQLWVERCVAKVALIGVLFVDFGNNLAIACP